jgi:hypothetical protein
MTMNFQRDKVIEVEIRLLGGGGRGDFGKKIVPPSNIVNEGGRTIPRCWHGG